MRRIEQGDLVRGMQLPSVRELAEELGVNKNTIVRVYRSLQQQGYLKVVQGSGTYVRGTPDGTAIDTAIDTAAPDTSWFAHLLMALQLAQRAGVEQDVVRQGVSDAIQQVYGQDKRRLLFIECNQYDIDTLSGTLTQAIGLSLHGVMLTDFLANPENYIAAYDFIVTTFFHLNEIQPFVRDLDRQRFVAVHAMPTQSALLEIARLQVPVLGVVADQPRALDNVIHIVKTYQPTAMIMSSSLEDSVRLQNLLDKADAIVVTPSRYAGLMKYDPQIPVVPMTLTISQESIEHLQQHLDYIPHAA